MEVISLRAAAVLHDLFVLGALILKPYFHLGGRNEKEDYLFFKNDRSQER